MSGAVFAALAIGLAIGVLGQRTHFCTMGALADFFLFGSMRRLRGFVLAAALALLAVQGLRLAGLPLAETPPPPAAGWPGAVLGGVLFGFGMVLAGGCWSRNLVRLGTGSLKALLVVAVAALTAAVVQQGLLTDGTSWLGQLVPVPASTTLGTKLGAPIGALMGLAAIAWCLADPAFRASGRDLSVGVTLAMLIIAGWLVAMREPTFPGVNFALAMTAMTRLDSAGLGAAHQLGWALVLGTVGGAFGAAWAARRLRLETFGTRNDMVQHIVGAVLLGAGGALAGGCTIGQGLSGLAAMLPTAPVATAGMAGGARWALHYLETGRLWPVRATS